MDGKKLDAANPRCKNVIDPEVARAAADMARCPVGDQSATGQCHGATASGVKGIVKRPLAGKTGTTDSEKSAAFVAMTKQLAVAGILTDPDNPQTREKMKHPPVNNAVAYTLRDGLAGKPVMQFTAPTRKKSLGNQVSIPNVKCQSVDQATSRLKASGFSVSVSGSQVASDCPVGTVAKTSPGGATIKGGSVSLILSSGPGAQGPGKPGNPGNTGNPRPGRTKCPLPWACPPNQ